MQVSKHRYAKTVWGLFVIYLAAVLAVTFLGRTPSAEPRIELIPLRALRQTFVFRHGTFRFIPHNYLNSVLNIVMLVPFGFMLRCLTRVKKRYIVLCGLLLSLTIETAQYFTHLGCFELDDLAHNTQGVVIGLILYGVFVRKRGCGGAGNDV